MLSELQSARCHSGREFARLDLTGASERLRDPQELRMRRRASFLPPERTISVAPRASSITPAARLVL
jgi:hypothetical protein